MLKTLCSALILAGVTSFSTTAQTVALSAPSESVAPPKKKFYLTSNVETYLLSTSSLSNGVVDNKMTTPRFTGFFHFGVLGNYDFNKTIGLQVGLTIKNLGFIEKYNSPDSTSIRRTYNIGIPLALKIGNLQGNNTYFLVGGGVDFPFHYKEKGFVKRSNKSKESEWFSDKTAQVMPYVFVGARFNPGVVLKFQYYPSNFMNKDYISGVTNTGTVIRPYQNYNVSTFLLTFGLDIKYTPKY